MASTSEVGHAKNVANFQDLIAFCDGYGATYNPSKDSLKLPALNTLLTTAQGNLTNVTAKNTEYNSAVNARVEAYNLADNYNAIYPENDGTFVIKCTETAIKAYPNFATALILRAETHKKQIENEKDNEVADQRFALLEKEYQHIHELGYRNMPEQMYINWLVSLKTERNKYENKNLNTFNKK